VQSRERKLSLEKRETLSKRESRLLQLQQVLKHFFEYIMYDDNLS
jgi:hypothetical protein